MNTALAHSLPCRLKGRGVTVAGSFAFAFGFSTFAAGAAAAAGFFSFYAGGAFVFAAVSAI